MQFFLLYYSNMEYSIKFHEGFDSHHKNSLESQTRKTSWLVKKEKLYSMD